LLALLIEKRSLCEAAQYCQFVKFHCAVSEKEKQKTEAERAAKMGRGRGPARGTAVPLRKKVTAAAISKALELYTTLSQFTILKHIKWQNRAS